jgi:hypothetical protein
MQEKGPEGKVVNDGETVSGLHALCVTTAASLREAHQMVITGSEQSEKVLVWLSGFMGAGIFSVYGLLAFAPLSIRLMAFVPWTVGILFAMVARVLSGELQLRNDQDHFKRVSMLELLQLETSADLVRTQLNSILTLRDGRESERKALIWWLRATRFAFYSVHVLFAMGVVAAVVAMIMAERWRDKGGI